MTIGDAPKPNIAPGQAREGKEKINFRILFADDDEDYRDSFKLLLERRGYTVEAVENGKLLLDKLATGEYDLVITDNQMPIKNGMEVVREIRSNKKFNKLTIMLMTGDANLNGELGKKIADLGAIYLKKPVEFEKLFTEIDKLTQKSEAEK